MLLAMLCLVALVWILFPPLSLCTNMAWSPRSPLHGPMLFPPPHIDANEPHATVPAAPRPSRIVSRASLERRSWLSRPTWSRRYVRCVWRSAVALRPHLHDKMGQTTSARSRCHIGRATRTDILFRSGSRPKFGRMFVCHLHVVRGLPRLLNSLFV
ncbi:hypothetical protein LY76DRAFT_224446 [Colletotrichum caudatum]|nr:hypothetical protein LY76DRAFT_224446 [Colletotrichum caudatum]